MNVASRGYTSRSARTVWALAFTWVFAAGASLPVLAKADFFDAVKTGSASRVNQYLAESPELINTRDASGATALHHAAALDDPTLLEQLMDRGADINARDDRGETPLHKAGRRLNVAAVKALLARGAFAHAANESGSTALYLAIRFGPNDPDSGERRKNIASLLLRSGTAESPDDPYAAKRKRKPTPLHVAAAYGRPELLPLLESADVSVADRYGRTPLHVAALGDHVEIVRWLLGKGANVNARDRQKETPLHQAAHRLQLRSAEVLLDAGAEVNAVNRRKETALHVMASSGANKKTDKKTREEIAARRLALAELLLKRGADVNAPDRRSATPIRVARVKHLDKLVTLLEKHQSPP